MNKKIVLLAVLLTKSLLAAAPTIECRFAALTADGQIGLDEAVVYTLNPQLGVAGSFDPYNFDISSFQNVLTVGIFVANKPVSAVRIPVSNVVALPLGATVFGLSTVFHDLTSGFISLQYECKKVL